MSNPLGRRALIAVCGAALLAMAGGARAQQVETGAAEIDIKNFNFEPSTLTVAAGTAVTWVNQDEEPHNIVNLGKPRLFRSQGLDGGDKYTFVFDKPGTYEYVCSVHPHMHGTIVVK
jgi:plastocyanin